MESESSVKDDAKIQNSEPEGTQSSEACQGVEKLNGDCESVEKNANDAESSKKELSNDVKENNEKREKAGGQVATKSAKNTRGKKRKASEPNDDENANSKIDKKDPEVDGSKGPQIELEKSDEKSVDDSSIDRDKDESKDKNQDKAKNDDASIPLSSTEALGKGKRARIPNKRYSDIALGGNSRRKSIEHTPINDLEIKQELLEEELPSFSQESQESIYSTPIHSPTVGKGSHFKMDDKYLEPFKHGWKRELVYRTTTSGKGKRQGDIYYYSPTGKKLRSMREILGVLKKSDPVTVENFTFHKEPLGADEGVEIIRDAKYKVSDTTTPLKKYTIPEKKILTPKLSADKILTPKPRLSAKGATTPKEKMKIKVPMKLKEKKMGKPEDSPDTNILPTSTPTKKPEKRTKFTPPESPSKPKKRNLKLKSITNSTSEERIEAKFMDNYFQNISFGYNTLLYVFQYLKVQDLLRAGCVCTMWRDIASHPILWRTVRMKNSQVHSFEGLANTLKKHGTMHLDMRKMLLPTSGEEIWPEFSKSIARVDTLRKIELCRCPANVVEQLAITNPDLEVLNAVTIKCESMNLDSLQSFTKIRELRLKSTSGLSVQSIDSLKELKTLKHLSLTSITNLHTHNLSVIAELTNLESLDLGECLDFPKNFGEAILAKLENLEKLRLEKGQGNCHTFDILNAVRNMKKLEQLELVNFDVKAGFDKALGGCQNIKKLMIIPTYISQSATTNHMVLGGVLRLQKTLSHFVWGVTLELLRVTELFVDQCEEPKEKKDKKPTGNGDSIPVLKPVPLLKDRNDTILPPHDPAQVEILSLPSLQKLLLNSLPTTRVKILKIPFHATWRQTLTDSVN